MARLIDANKLKSAVAESFAPYQREWAETICQIAKVIDEQPAYDVEQLEANAQKMSESNYMLNRIMNTLNQFEPCEFYIVDDVINRYLIDKEKNVLIYVYPEHTTITFSFSGFINESIHISHNKFKTFTALMCIIFATIKEYYDANKLIERS